MTTKSDPVVSEPIVVQINGEGEVINAETFVITMDGGEATGTVTVTSTANPASQGIAPDTMMHIGVAAIGVGLILIIIAAVLINRALKANAPAQPVSAPISFAPAAIQQTDDPQLVAVITAALTAYMGQNASGPLVVRSIRRAQPASAWANAGRQEQIRF